MSTYHLFVQGPQPYALVASGAIFLALRTNVSSYNCGVGMDSYFVPATIIDPTETPKASKSRLHLNVWYIVLPLVATLIRFV